MNGRLALACSLVIVAAFASGSSGAEDAPRHESPCTVRDSTGLTRVVVCPPGLDEEALKAAGEEACGITVTCSAWIWDDERKAPRELPDDTLDVDPKYARNAVAVWFNENNGLMMIRPVTE